MAAEGAPAADVLCPLLTGQRRCPEETDSNEGTELKAYKLGKKRWSYNQVELIVHNAGGGNDLHVAEAAQHNPPALTEPQKEFGVTYMVRLGNGQRLLLNVFLVYEEAMKSDLPSDLSEQGGGPAAALPASAAAVGAALPVPLRSSTQSWQWTAVTRAACKKGCTGPVIRAIQRFGRLGRRNMRGQAETAAAEQAQSQDPGTIRTKDAKYLYLSLDEAGTHVGGRRFRLLVGAYDEEGANQLGTGCSPPIRVLANNDVPEGAACIRLHITLKSSWKGWAVREEEGQAAAPSAAQAGGPAPLRSARPQVASPSPSGARGAAQRGKRKAVRARPSSEDEDSTDPEAEEAEAMAAPRMRARPQRRAAARTYAESDVSGSGGVPDDPEGEEPAAEDDPDEPRPAQRQGRRKRSRPAAAARAGSRGQKETKEEDKSPVEREPEPAADPAAASGLSLQMLAGKPASHMAFNAAMHDLDTRLQELHSTVCMPTPSPAGFSAFSGRTAAAPDGRALTQLLQHTLGERWAPSDAQAPMHLSSLPAFEVGAMSAFDQSAHEGGGDGGEARPVKRSRIMTRAGDQPAGSAEPQQQQPYLQQHPFPAAQLLAMHQQQQQQQQQQHQRQQQQRHHMGSLSNLLMGFQPLQPGLQLAQLAAQLPVSHGGVSNSLQGFARPPPSGLAQQGSWPVSMHLAGPQPATMQGFAEQQHHHQLPGLLVPGLLPQGFNLEGGGGVNDPGNVPLSALAPLEGQAAATEAFQSFARNNNPLPPSNY